MELLHVGPAEELPQFLWTGHALPPDVGGVIGLHAELPEVQLAGAPPRSPQKRTGHFVGEELRVVLRNIVDGARHRGFQISCLFGESGLIATNMGSGTLGADRGTGSVFHETPPPPQLDGAQYNLLRSGARHPDY
eukprot:991564-Prymnesium_polylepis.3